MGYLLKSLGAALAAGLLCLAGGEAAACSIQPVEINGVPVPVETPEMIAARQADYELRRQGDLWARADQVFVARAFHPYELEAEAPPPTRFSRSGRPLPPVPIPPPEIHMLGEGKTIFVLEPLTALKGVAPARRFEIRDLQGWTTCGPLPQMDVFYRSGDGLFVVFVDGPYPTQSGVLDAMAADRITDPDIRAALDKAGAAR